MRLLLTVENKGARSCLRRAGARWHGGTPRPGGRVQGRARPTATQLPPCLFKVCDNEFTSRRLSTTLYTAQGTATALHDLPAEDDAEAADGEKSDCAQDGAEPASATLPDSTFNANPPLGEPATPPFAPPFTPAEAPLAPLSPPLLLLLPPDLQLDLLNSAPPPEDSGAPNTSSPVPAPPLLLLLLAAPGPAAGPGPRSTLRRSSTDCSAWRVMDACCSETYSIKCRVVPVRDTKNRVKRPYKSGSQTRALPNAFSQGSQGPCPTRGTNLSALHEVRCTDSYLRMLWFVLATVSPRGTSPIIHPGPLSVPGAAHYPPARCPRTRPPVAVHDPSCKRPCMPLVVPLSSPHLSPAHEHRPRHPPVRCPRTRPG